MSPRFMNAYYSRVFQRRDKKREGSYDAVPASDLGRLGQAADGYPPLGAFTFGFDSES